MDDERTLGYLVGEVELQCALAIYAYERLYPAMGVEEMTEQMERIFFYIHAFMTHAGNVSKLLWPVQSRKARGENLRRELGVSDGSNLKDRTMRNHLEHYDERLEDWLNAPHRHGLIDMAIVVRQSGHHIENADYHRGFDPSDMSFVYQDESINLISLSHALRDLRDVAREWLFSHGIWNGSDYTAWYNQKTSK